MFTASFRDKCIGDIKTKIGLPTAGYFVKGQDHIRICYTLDGTLKYINLASTLEVAQFLIKHGYIHHYAVIDDEVKMINVSLTATAGDKGQLKWERLLVQFKWEQINITPDEVIMIAARREFEKAGKTMGVIKTKAKGKVVNLTKYLLQQRAS